MTNRYIYQFAIELIVKCELVTVAQGSIPSINIKFYWVWISKKPRKKQKFLEPRLLFGLFCQKLVPGLIRFRSDFSNKRNYFIMLHRNFISIFM